MVRRLIFATVLLALVVVPGHLFGGRTAAEVDSLQARIDAAAPGDTIYVNGGTYRENVVIAKPLELIGEGWPVIDGGGEGDVVTVTADEVSISGFEIRGSGRSVSQEPAAVKVSDAHAFGLRSSRIRDSHFGIHMTGGHHAEIAFNDIDLGAATPVERRGHAIYLWKVAGSAIHGNRIKNAADGIHLEFSESNGIGENTVTDSRYALHFMYANGNKVLSNTFRHNLAGAVIMFSKILVLKDNELSENRRGATGAGILLKDVDDIFAQGNRVLRNKFGLMADGSPQTPGATATFMDNLFALNDTGVGLMTSAPITFVDNAMIENTVQVKALGGSLTGHEAAPDTPDSGGGGHEGHGATPAAPAPVAPSAGSKQATWTIGGRGNYWSDYKGYDADGDGVGDRPYQPQPPFAGALSDNDTLRLFQFTVAQQAIDVASDMFPLYEYDAVIQDSGPLMQAPGPALPGESGINRGLLVVSALLLLLSGAVAQAVLGIDIAQPIRRVFSPAGGRLGREGGS